MSAFKTVVETYLSGAMLELSSGKYISKHPAIFHSDEIGSVHLLNTPKYSSNILKLLLNSLCPP